MDVTMPQLGETVTEGTITRWFKQVGEHDRGRRAAVRGLDRQGRLRSARAAARACVSEILVPEGETVAVGARLAVISRRRRGTRAAPAAPAAAARAPKPPPAPDRRPDGRRRTAAAPRRRPPPAPAPAPARAAGATARPRRRPRPRPPSRAGDGGGSSRRRSCAG